MHGEDATVGELVQLLDDGRFEYAWILASEEIDEVVRARQVQRTPDVEDSASESLVRIFDDGQSALRRADPSCPLQPWLRGVITNVLREVRRSQRERTDPAVVDNAATTDVGRAESRTKWGRVDLRVLTPKQRNAVRLRLRGISWSRMARILGISRRAARDRVDSAVRRLKRLRREDDRSWAQSLVRSQEPQPTRMPQELARQMLRMYANGVSHREIAHVLGVSSEAVRHRIRRLRRRAMRRV